MTRTSAGTALARFPAVVRRCRPAAVVVAALLAALAAAPAPAAAGSWFVELEPLAVRRGGDNQLPSVFTVSVGRARASGMLRPFAAAGGGLLNVQARAGVMALARGSGHDGPTMLLQLRAMHAVLCAEQGVFGGVGLGYRWWREGKNPFGVALSVEAGPARLRPTCGPEVAIADAPVVRGWLGGGSLALTIGF